MQATDFPFGEENGFLLAQTLQYTTAQRMRKPPSPSKCDVVEPTASVKAQWYAYFWRSGKLLWEWKVLMLFLFCFCFSPSFYLFEYTWLGGKGKQIKSQGNCWILGDVFEELKIVLGIREYNTGASSVAIPFPRYYNNVKNNSPNGVYKFTSALHRWEQTAVAFFLTKKTHVCCRLKIRIAVLPKEAARLMLNKRGALSRQVMINTCMREHR